MVDWSLHSYKRATNSFGARGLTTAEKRYTQIKKEMLAIVVGCEKFDQYIYGHTI